MRLVPLDLIYPTGLVHVRIYLIRLKENASMRILGIYDGHNCGSAIIEDGKIIAAIEEERLSRIKLHDGRTKHGPPEMSLSWVLEYTKSERSNIDRIAVAISPPYELLKYVLKDVYLKQKNMRWSLAVFGRSPGWDMYYPFYPYFYNFARIRNIKKLLRRFDLDNIPIDFVDHHTAHAASAYYTSGEADTMIITMDGQGDGESGAVFSASGGKIKKIRSLSSYNSVGMFYNLITWVLGFKPNRHEGKVTGLAAHGNAEVTKPYLETLFDVNCTDFSYDLAKKIFMHPYPHRTPYNILLQKTANKLKDFSKKDLAAGVQTLSEEYVCKFTESVLEGKVVDKLCLAGGVFANVRINQEISELDNIRSVFIFPAMGDNGLFTGAALYSYFGNNEDEYIPEKIGHVYFGPEYSNKEIQREIEKANLKHKYFENIEVEIAKLLADGKVVARFNGRMEYGPRALGNRSILYQTTDPTVNDWLNKKLNRTEFMPFAPAALMEDANQLFMEIDSNIFPATYMTQTFDCTEEMQKNYPAVVHVDNTARPQLVDEKTNSSFYNTIKEYKKLTGLSAIINTSFNMHEEPIVCTPFDGIRAFQLGHLDYLAIGDFLIRSNNTENKP